MGNPRIRILVLGADGFMGSNLVKSLVQNDRYSIRAFDLFRYGQSKNLGDVQKDVEIFSGDFLNREDVRHALEGVDYVFHFVSLTTPGSSMQDPFIDVDTNIRGTITLLDESVNASIKKVIFASSGGAIYGNSAKKLLGENDVTNPISPYAISKLTIEKYLEYYRVSKGLPYLALRYSNPYGPGQNIFGSQGVIPIFLNLVRQGKPITVFGDGKNVRDYMYIDDAIDITRKIFEMDMRHNLYNVGSGEGTDINRLISVIEEVSGIRVRIDRRPMRSVDVRSIVLDVSRISNEIGFTSGIDLKEGISRTWKWLGDSGF